MRLLKIRLNSIISYILPTVFVCLFFQRLYVSNPEQLANRIWICSGLGIIILFIIFYAYKSERKIDLFITISIYLLLLYSLISFLFLKRPINELIKYFIFYIYIFLAFHSRNVNFNLICKTLIVVGFLYSIIDYINNVERVTGFMWSSPTIFSLIILTAALYIYDKKKGYQDYIYLFISFIIIFLTKSRTSIMLFGIVIIINYFRKKSWSRRFFVIWVSAILCGIILLGINNVSSSLNITPIEVRENQDQSDKTRISLTMMGINAFQVDKNKRLLGYGLGYSYKEIGKGYPLHNDILTLLIDYGWLGFFIILLIVIMRFRTINIEGWIILFFSCIHNIVLFPLLPYFVLSIARKGDNTDNE